MTDAEREALEAWAIKIRNETLELAAHYFSAMGPDRAYTVPQIVGALRGLKVERFLRDPR